MRFPFWLKRTRHTSTARRPRDAGRKQYHLQILPLEDRVVPAVTATFDGTTHKLTVTADAADNISITVSGTDVKVNGADPDRTPAGSTLAADVHSIQVAATGNFANT